MICLKHSILKAVTVWLFTFAMIFPEVVRFVHQFEHISSDCREQGVTHFHKKNVDCSLYDFHFSSIFSIDAASFEFTAQTYYSFTNKFSLSVYPEFYFQKILLRGPPA